MQKTRKAASQNYFWKGCGRETKEFVLNCETCQLSKGNVVKKAPLESYPSDLFPFQCVSMDTVGPFPCTTNGNKFILVFVDFLSRYTEIIPVKDRTQLRLPRPYVTESLPVILVRKHCCRTML